MKWYIQIILVLMMFPIVSATEMQCEVSPDNLTWTNITRFGGSINDEFDEAYIPLLNKSTLYYFRCRNSTTNYAYTSQRTERSFNMADIAIIGFLLFIIIGLFGLGFLKKFSKNVIANLILKRGCFVLGLWMMMYTAGVLSTIASDAGLALTQEMFLLMRVFGYAGYVGIIYLFVRTVFDIVAMYNKIIYNKRMGEE